MNKTSKTKMWLPTLFIALTSCAGVSRGCSGCVAEEFGSDWIVVQQRMLDGKPYNCWQPRNVSIANEGQSDGIYWKDSSGHLIHIAGQYIRVQVVNNDFTSAAKLVGVDLSRCVGGAYEEKK